MLFTDPATTGHGAPMGTNWPMAARRGRFRKREIQRLHPELATSYLGGGGQVPQIAMPKTP